MKLLDPSLCNCSFRADVPARPSLCNSGTAATEPPRCLRSPGAHLGTARGCSGGAEVGAKRHPKGLPGEGQGSLPAGVTPAAAGGDTDPRHGSRDGHVAAAHRAMTFVIRAEPSLCQR